MSCCHPTTASLRLRAAVFVNLVAMRDAMSLSNNPTTLLTKPNLEQLRKACFLFHAAYNRSMAKNMRMTPVLRAACASMVGAAGLATTALAAGKLLWKIRPKYHKWLCAFYPSQHLAECADCCAQDRSSLLRSSKPGQPVGAFVLWR